MSERRVQMVGQPCGHHGSYAFYKAFSFACAGRRRVLALGEFFFVQLWTSKKEVCIGELQLVFEDSASNERLACLRLYFLPECTPEGRLEVHGEDEVVAVQERLTVRLEELADVVVRPEQWTVGWAAGAGHDAEAPPAALCTSDATCRLRLDDVERTKRSLGDTVGADDPCALVLSYDHYCRLRGVMKRLEGVNPRVYGHAVVRALGGVRIPSRSTRLLYCRDTFEYPELDGHELFCNHLAPKLRGRSRKKARQEASSPSSESTSDTESVLQKAAVRLGRPPLHLQHRRQKPTLLAPARAHHQLRSFQWGQKEFLQRLHRFMTGRGTPITRVPSLGGGWGLQPVNLYRLYRRVQECGGYQAVCTRNLWRQVFHDMGGDRGNRAGATHTRRLFERLCLPFERAERGSVDTMVRSGPAMVGQPQAAQSSSSETALLTALAQSRPSITITAIPRTTGAAAPPPPPRAVGRPRKYPAPVRPASNGGIELIDLTSSSAAASASSVATQPIVQPTRIGSITITPVEKAAAPAPAPAVLGSVEQLMALHMASTSVSPQMLQLMSTGKATGFEQIQRAQQQLALHTLMTQRMSMMPSMPGLSKEQAQASVEAYKRMLQGGFRKS